METQNSRPKAVLIGIQLPRVAESDTASSLAELHRLVDTLGFEVVGQLGQKRSSLKGAVVVGEGKLREIALWTGGPGKVESPVKVKKSKAAEKRELQEETDLEEIEDAESEDNVAEDSVDNPADS